MCETRAFGPHQVLPELLDIIAGYCTRSDLVNLGLVCKNWHGIVVPRLWRRVRLKHSTGIRCVKYRHWIVGVESPFEPLWLLPLLSLLPNLRELFLHDVKNLDALATLFDLNISVLKISQHRDVNWNFCWEPSVDRVRARSFLHRLVSIDFGEAIHEIPTESEGIHNIPPESTIIWDAVHKGLQKIGFGASFVLPIDLLSVPRRLTVFCAPCTQIPETFFRIIADHCPHLRALSCSDLPMDCDPHSHWAVMLVESFRYFMRRRGARLVALEFSMLAGDIDELFEAAMLECHSLEYFAIKYLCDPLDPEQLNYFLSQCGHSLKYLTIFVEGYVEGGAEKWIKDLFGMQLPIRCPNIRIGRFRVKISGDDGERKGYVVYHAAGRWKWSDETISECFDHHGYFDHTTYLW
ncbi:hypothetical protein HK102_002696 [Quaeritorhiza haematococci]|nr:hypothetical protein HK102_002696 [Quaeritorhiza haematococci]